MDTNTIAIIAIAVLALLMSVGVPVFAALGLSGITGLVLLEDFSFVFNRLKSMPYHQSASYLLTVIPLFILMGAFAHHAGVGQKLFGVARKWVGHRPGGLAMASIITCAGFAATSGSSVATAATVGSVAIPEMHKSGYDNRLAAGAVAAGGVLGVLIPPSVLLIFYAALTEVSAGKMLVAGIIPGLVTTAVFMIGIAVIARRVQSSEAISSKTSWGTRFSSLKDAWQVLVLFLLVLGSIYFGLATPTEAGALGACAGLVMLLTSKKAQGKRKRSLYTSFRSAITVTTMIFFTMLGAAIFSYFLSLAQIPQELSNAVVNSGFPPVLIVALLLVIYLPLGMFLDAFSMLVISLPIMFPTVVALGYDPIWFGVLAVKMCEIGLITPPVGLNVYVIAGIDKNTPMERIFQGAWWFVIMEIITTTLLFSLPWLVTWLPAQME